MLLEDRALVDAVLENPETAPISAAEKTLLAFVARVNGGSYDLRDEHLEPVRAAGWTDEAIYDAVSVCALFNFYNRWCDGTGVQPMSPADYAGTGERLSRVGYLPPADPK